MKLNHLQITIKETTKEDLINIMSLWNDGEVMHFVGFPKGLGITMGKMESWIKWVISKPQRCHYSIYAKDIGYCGETFYSVDDNGGSALDIKLFPQARGKGIAKQALLFAIKQAFCEGNAKWVYVDPHPDNKDAWKLYTALGFLSVPRPKYLGEGETYLEITKDQWELHKNSLLCRCYNY
jgi:RimJ/RimL family protein N-acetyltransferase